jgi:hypothetical protein
VGNACGRRRVCSTKSPGLAFCWGEHTSLEELAQHGAFRQATGQRHWIELAASENTVLALEPMSLMVPTTITRITANMTAYSAMSWP